ncbi:MAG: hypothetical protein PWQ10_423 [Patescibacteria group bacterium]|nr:hypothetical protein [Patescibacteria group bacterium]
MFEKAHNDLDILSEVAYKNKLYLNNEIDVDGRYTIDVAWNIIKTLKDNTSEIKGGFGVGFPFHSLDQSGKLITNPEFSRYIDEFSKKIETSRSLGCTAWNCFSCQVNENYTPDNCKGCDQVYVKPRDVMKVMPDIDVFLIADEITPDLLRRIQYISKEYGFQQSDINAYETLCRTHQAFENIEDGRGNVNLPGDMHIISMEDYIYAMDLLSNGVIDIDIDVYSLHHQWVLNNKIDFAFDFMFSSTFNDNVCDSGIKELADAIKSDLANKYSENDILDIVRSKSKRAEVLLSYKPSLDIFIERVRSWSRQ